MICLTRYVQNQLQGMYRYVTHTVALVEDMYVLLEEVFCEGRLSLELGGG